MRIVDHHTQSEQARTLDLMRLLPSEIETLLEIGARDGYYSTLFSQRCSQLIALDITRPRLAIERICCVQGDIANLGFRDNSCDCVVCTEVLEHIHNPHRAAQELQRVARRDIIVGVPYRQDTRLGETRCGACGEINPPFGHVNSFTLGDLRKLFDRSIIKKMSFVGITKSRTNVLASSLMKFAGNPWGTYQQEEACVFCSSKIGHPKKLGLGQRVAASVSHRIQTAHSRVSHPWPQWVHVHFRKVEFSP
jgi:SAM-dependent methyltransferase